MPKQKEQKEKIPKGWRKGQTIFNFLAWLTQKGYGNPNPHRLDMADPYYITDEDWDKWYQEFLK